MVLEIQKYKIPLGNSCVCFSSLLTVSHREKCIFYIHLCITEGLPGGSAGKESACNAGDLDSIPGLGRREGLPIPVFWPGEFHGLYSPWGCKESDMTEQLSVTYKIEVRVL